MIHKIVNIIIADRHRVCRAARVYGIYGAIGIGRICNIIIVYQIACVSSCRTQKDNTSAAIRAGTFYRTIFNRIVIGTVVQPDSTCTTSSGITRIRNYKIFC